MRRMYGEYERRKKMKSKKEEEEAPCISTSGRFAHFGVDIFVENCCFFYVNECTMVCSM